MVVQQAEGGALVPRRVSLLSLVHEKPDFLDNFDSTTDLVSVFPVDEIRPRASFRVDLKQKLFQTPGRTDICYRLWQSGLKSPMIKQQKLAEMPFRWKIFNFRFLACIIK